MNGLNQNLIILNNDNFDIWLDQLTQMLYGNKVGDLISKEYAAEGVEAAAKDGGEESKTKLDSTELERQGKAMYCLNSTISEDDRRYVLQKKTLKERIDLLKALRSPAVDVYSLYDQLARLELREPLERFIGEIESIRAKVHNHPDTPNSDETPFVQKLLKSLPRDMAYTKLHYEREIKQKKGKVNWSELAKEVAEAYRDVLEERERKMKERNRDQDHPVRPSRAANPYGFQFANVQRCFKCGSINHRVRNCPELNGVQDLGGRADGFSSRYNSADGRGRDNLNGNELNASGQGEPHGQWSGRSGQEEEQEQRGRGSQFGNGDQAGRRAESQSEHGESEHRRMVENAVRRQPNLDYSNSFFSIATSEMQVRAGQWVLKNEEKERTSCSFEKRPAIYAIAPQRT